SQTRRRLCDWGCPPSGRRSAAAAGARLSRGFVWIEGAARRRLSRRFVFLVGGASLRLAATPARTRGERPSGRLSRRIVSFRGGACSRPAVTPFRMYGRGACARRPRPAVARAEAEMGHACAIRPVAETGARMYGAWRARLPPPFRRPHAPPILTVGYARPFPGHSAPLARWPGNSIALDGLDGRIPLRTAPFAGRPGSRRRLSRPEYAGRVLPRGALAARRAGRPRLARRGAGSGHVRAGLRPRRAGRGQQAQAGDARDPAAA